MSKDTGLAAVHAAATLGSTVTAVTLQAQPEKFATNEKTEAPPAAIAAPGATKMVGMPEAEYQANLASANASGRADGAKAATARIKAIITAPEARGKDQLAQSIAFDTELNQEQAVAMLKAAPDAQKVSRLDGNVPAPQVDASETGKGDTAKASLAAATSRLIEKTYGKPAA